MKVEVDVTRCCGHARCATVAADLFVLNDIGYLDTPVITIPEGEEALATRGVRACPERCLKIVGED